MKFTREEIQETTGAHLVHPGRYLFFDGTAIDSRSCGWGQLFVALKGARTDGHLFISDAFQMGVWGALVEKVPESLAVPSDRVLFQVDDTLKALKSIGQRASRRLQGQKVAITGTAGKTTCKNFLQALLQRKFSTEVTPQSFNTPLGVSCALANFQETTQVAIVEAGISAVGEMTELAFLIDPEVVIFTAFGEGHLEGLGSVEGVIEEKSKLVGPKTQLVYLNATHPRAVALAGRWTEEGKKVIVFGDSEEQGIALSHFTIALPRFQSNFSVQWDGKVFHFQSEVLFEEVLVSFLPAIHLALSWGVSFEEVAEVLRGWKSPPGRGHHFFYQQGVVIDDSYNANPLSYRKALRLLKRFAQMGLETWLVAGDMLELGSFSRQAHRSVLQEVLSPPRLSGVILFGPYFQEIVKQEFQGELQDGFFRIFSSHEAIRRFLVTYFHSRSQWAVLFKGSRGMTMERAIPEEWQEDHG